MVAAVAAVAAAHSCMMLVVSSSFGAHAHGMYSHELHTVNFLYAPILVWHTKPAQVVTYLIGCCCCTLQIRFWGVDSGIRHSVGGADYGSVRVGTFMGLRIIHDLALPIMERSSSTSMAGALTAAASDKRHYGEGKSPRFFASDDGSSAVEGSAGSAVWRSSQPRESSSSLGSSFSGGNMEGSSPRVNEAWPRGPIDRSNVAFGGYLANVSPSQFKELYEQELPLYINGDEFLAHFGSHLDPVTTIDPSARYAIRMPTAHPIGENFRVNAFRMMLAATPELAEAVAAAAAARRCKAEGFGTCGGSNDSSSSRDQPATADASEACRGTTGDVSAPTLTNGSHDTSEGLQAVTLSSTQSDAGATAATAHVTQSPADLGPLEVLGELMFESHASYSACGLGSDGTNRLVNIVREHMASARSAGRPPALYGAKITGGGCGGTVCIMGLAGLEGQQAVDEVVARYATATGHQPQVFEGSSVGAARFGHLKARLKAPAVQQA